jgi:hypothetical protein
LVTQVAAVSNGKLKVEENMFRDSEMGDAAAKPAHDKQGEKMEHELAQSGSETGRDTRRAEGDPANSEPRMDFDRQDQAVQFVSRPRVKTDPSRDALLTSFGKATLTDRYLMTKPMRSASTIIFPSFGSCQPLRFCRMVAPIVAYRFRAF